MSSEIGDGDGDGGETDCEERGGSSQKRRFSSWLRGEGVGCLAY